MIHYEHTQRPSIVYVLAFAGLALAIAVLALEGNYSGMIIILFIPLLMFLFSGSLTVRLDETTLTVFFGIGIIRRRFPLADLMSCEQTRTRWYEGWGIHPTVRGWLFNIAGRDAVIFTRRDGRHFLVGTDEPQRLQAAILQAMSVRHHG